MPEHGSSLPCGLPSLCGSMVWCGVLRGVGAGVSVRDVDIGVRNGIQCISQQRKRLGSFLVADSWFRTLLRQQILRLDVGWRFDIFKNDIFW